MRARFCIAAREKDEGTKGARSRARRRAAHIVYMYYSILRFIIIRATIVSIGIESRTNGSRTCHRTITYSNYLPVYLIVVKDERKRSCGSTLSFLRTRSLHARIIVDPSRYHAADILRSSLDRTPPFFFFFSPHFNYRSYSFVRSYVVSIESVCVRFNYTNYNLFLLLFLYLLRYIVGGEEKVEKEKKKNNNNNKIKYFIISVDFIAADLRKKRS